MIMYDYLPQRSTCSNVTRPSHMKRGTSGGVPLAAQGAECQTLHFRESRRTEGREGMDWGVDTVAYLTL